MRRRRGAVKGSPPATLVLRDTPQAVRVRESARARNARLVVASDGSIEAVVPAGASRRAVERLIRDNRPWIERTLEARRPRLGLDRPFVVWLETKPVPTELVGGRRSRAVLRDGRVLVSGPIGLAPAALERWYRRQAREAIGTAVQLEAARLGLTPAAVSIRDQRTRWGSCSARGALSFSWRLVIAPPSVLDYVVVHELCHLRVPAHSHAFWRLVEAARPGWKADANWLREYGHELQAYRPASASTVKEVP